MSHQDIQYVLIPGMHRSGTSLAGQLLESLGYSVGKSPMLGHPTNPEGFSENLEIVKFHDEILAQAQSSWCDLHCLPAEWWTEEVLKDLSGKLARLLDVEFAGQGRRVIKDPRLCRLLPLWQYYFANTGTTNVRYLLPMRSPREVARSLQVRDGTSLSLGLFLWTQHVLAAERATRGHRRLLTTYEEMMDHKAAPALASFLELQTDKVAARLAQTAKASLYRQRQNRPQQEAEHPVEALAEQTWSLFATAGRDGNLDQTGLDALWQRYLALQQIVPADFDGRSVVQNTRLRQSHLFFDYGNGFNASDLTSASLELLDGSFHLRFEIPKADQTICKLRWDPLEGVCCQLTVNEAITNASPLKAIPINAHSHEHGRDIFLTHDPMYALKGEVKGVQWIELRGRLEVIPESEIIARFTEEKRRAASAAHHDSAVVTPAASQHIKKLKRELEQLKQQEAACRRAVSAWNQRSWLTRAFHRLRLKQPDKIATRDAAKKNEPSKQALLEAQKAARQAVDSLQSLRRHWLGRWMVRSAMLRAASKLQDKAEQALQRSHPDQAMDLWSQSVAQCARVLEGIRAKPLGRWTMRSRQLRQMVKLADKVQQAQTRWLKSSKAERSRPQPKGELPLFDAAFFLSAYPDIAAAGLAPLEHYLQHGWKEGRNPMPLFDVTWYLRQNPDVTAAGLEPLGHYFNHGWRTGRDPHPRFDTAWYLRTYPDVAAAQINPLKHYVLYGSLEGRSIQGSNPPLPLATPSPSRVTKAENKPSVTVNPDSCAIIFVAGHDEQALQSLFSLAKQLAIQGHAIHICLPEGRDGVAPLSQPWFRYCTWQEALEKPGSFASASGKQLIHAWTLQEEATSFVGHLQAQLKCPVFVHLPGSEQQEFTSSTQSAFLAAASGITFENRAPTLPQTPPLLQLWPAANPELFRATPLLLAERRRHGIADHETIVAHAGQVTGANHEIVKSLHEAIQLLRQQGFPVRLLHAGSDEALILDQAAARQDDSVIALGQMSHTHIPKVLGMADFLMLPQTDRDQPLLAQMAEYLSIGRPVLLPQSSLETWPLNGEHAVVLRNGQAAEIADRLSTLIPDFEKCETLSLGALAFAKEHFNATRGIAALTSFYQHILEDETLTVAHHSQREVAV